MNDENEDRGNMTYSELPSYYHLSLIYRSFLELPRYHTNSRNPYLDPSGTVKDLYPFIIFGRPCCLLPRIEWVDYPLWFIPTILVSRVWVLSHNFWSPFRSESQYQFIEHNLIG